MNILHFVFTYKWSWGLTSASLEKAMPQHQWQHCQMNRQIVDLPCDIILSQQITLMRYIREKHKTVCRLGGNRSFDEDKPMAFDEEIKQTYAVIATNNRLFNISKQLNPNTFLIPNGVDLTEWRRVIKPKNFTVGFCGNISKIEYREYKGYDFVVEACSNLGLPLKTALFNSEQIVHNQMREKFYSKISVLVHPSKGEGCSNVIMEALACGVPVITTKVAGYHGEELKDGQNVLFCERTTPSVVECLLKLLNQKTLCRKLSAQGRIFAEKNHDINKIAKQYENIFLDCYKTNQERRQMLLENPEPVRPLRPKFVFPQYKSTR